MRIAAVTFDADDTLWDFGAAMRRALELVAAEARAAQPQLTDGLGVTELQRVRDRLAAEAEGTGELLASIRRRAIRRALADAGSDDPELAERLAERYFVHRREQLRVYDDVVPTLDALAGRVLLGLVTNGNTDAFGAGLPGRFAFRLSGDDIGIRKPDPRLFAMAAAAAGCEVRELVHVGDRIDTDVLGAQRAGAVAVWLDRSGEGPPDGVRPDATITSLRELPGLLGQLEHAGSVGDEARRQPEVGVGPHPEPWPEDPRLDPALLREGDRRNVVDRYRWWRHEAIVADLDARRAPFHVAIENWRDDRNIGAVVRNANAFGAASVRIVGRRRWNRRGAMVTDRYEHVVHHASLDDLLRWASKERLPVVGIDNLDGAVPIESIVLPRRCVLLFGQEGPGLSPAARAAAALVCSITQVGSTRSINAGVASGIAMHAWLRAHAGETPDTS